MLEIPNSSILTDKSMKRFEVLLTSPPDREKLVAEILLADNMVAEISKGPIISLCRN